MGLLQSWDLSRDFQAHEEYLLRCLISPNCRTIATTSADKSIKLWTSQPSLVQSQSISLPAGAPVSSSASSSIVSPPPVPSNQGLPGGSISSNSSFSGYGNHTWELEKSLLKHQRWVWDCVFSSDSMYLISASSDHSAKLWDLSTGEVVRNYTAHGMTVACVALNDLPALQ